MAEKTKGYVEILPEEGSMRVPRGGLLKVLYDMDIGHSRVVGGLPFRSSVCEEQVRKHWHDALAPVPTTAGLFRRALGRMGFEGPSFPPDATHPPGFWRIQGRILRAQTVDSGQDLKSGFKEVGRFLKKAIPGQKAEIPPARRVGGMPNEVSRRDGDAKDQPMEIKQPISGVAHEKAPVTFGLIIERPSTRATGAAIEPIPAQASPRHFERGPRDGGLGL